MLLDEGDLFPTDIGGLFRNRKRHARTHDFPICAPVASAVSRG